MMQAAVPPAASEKPRRGVQIRYRVQGVEIRYRIEEFSEHWIVPEEIPVPEAPWHDLCLEYLRALLVAWVARTARSATVFRDIKVGVRRDEPRVGFNPDVCIVEPALPDATELDSLKLWEPSPGPPAFAFEAVSRNHPYKDYSTAPEKCGVVGVQELVVFDPHLAGPRAAGGPWLLQVWRRGADDTFERVYAGDGPAWSEYLGAYLLPNRADRRLGIASASDGSGRWLTREEEAEHRAEEERRKALQAQRAAEAAQQAAEAAQQKAEAAHQAAEEARRREELARAQVAALEAELARLRNQR